MSEIKRGRQTRKNPGEAGGLIHDGSRPSSSSSSSSDGQSISSRSSSSEALSAGRSRTSSSSESRAYSGGESKSSSSSKENSPESGRRCGQDQRSEFRSSSKGREIAVENKSLRCSGRAILEHRVMNVRDSAKRVAEMVL